MFYYSIKIIKNIIINMCLKKLNTSNNCCYIVFLKNLVILNSNCYRLLYVSNENMKKAF